MGGFGRVVACHVGERPPSYAINDMINARENSNVLLMAPLTALTAQSQLASHLGMSALLPTSKQCPPGATSDQSGLYQKSSLIVGFICETHPAYRKRTCLCGCVSSALQPAASTSSQPAWNPGPTNGGLASLHLSHPAAAQ